MSRHLVVATSARADLVEIRDPLGQAAGRPAAARVLNALWDATSALAAGTAVGHPRLDLAADPARFYLVYRDFIVHRVDPSDLIVLRVLHTARDVRAILS